MFGRRRERAATGNKIFLSYRRTDSADLAQRLHAQLAATFGADQVFMDLHSIRPGDEFPAALRAALDETGVVLALIGSGWAAGPVGRSRIDDERDYVRIEVATALDKPVHVIPVRIENADLPSPSSLPLDVGMIARLNAVPLRAAHFPADCELIIRSVRERLGQRVPHSTVPDELLGLWASTGTGDAELQYEFFRNRTYRFVGLMQQAVPNGVFEFSTTHEGHLAVDGDSITLDAFRAAASRSHPGSPHENYTDQDRRPESVTLTWRLQARGSENLLVLSGAGAPAAVYRRISATPTATRARQTPVSRLDPPGAGDTASGGLVDWFPLFGDEPGVRVNRLTGWKLHSTPGDPAVYLFDPSGQAYTIDLAPIVKDGSFTPIEVGGRLLPVEIGWYAGGRHQGTRRDGSYGEYVVAPGYIARWVRTPG